MSTFEKDMNAEIQLQAAYAMNAQLRDQIDSLNRTVWSLRSVCAYRTRARRT